MDTIQALILTRKLKELNRNNNKRKKIAKIYDQKINNKKIIKLKYSKGCVYHQYVIISKLEKKIIKFLKNDIQYGKHYPTPIHKLSSTKKIFPNQKYKMQNFFQSME